jgi:hypothetical protein
MTEKIYFKDKTINYCWMMKIRHHFHHYMTDANDDEDENNVTQNMKIKSNEKFRKNS